MKFQKDIQVNSIKDKIETRFKLFGLWVFDNRIKTLLLVLMIAAGFVSQLPKITVDTSSEGFLHKSDPILISYDHFREQFGRDEIIVLAIKSPEVFEQKFLKKLSELHQELEDNVPFLDDINSLINARNTHGYEDQLIVEDLFEEIPQSLEEMQIKKSFALNSSLFKNFVLSEDGSFTTIMIRSSAFASEDISTENMEAGFEDTAPNTNNKIEKNFLTDVQNSQIVNKVREIIAKYQSENFQIYAAGSPVVVDAIKRAMQHDMQKFIKLALLIIAIVLFLLFRRISGVFLPLLVVILTLLSTISMMAISGVSIKLPTQILPLFLLAVGVAAAVHLLAIFFRHFNEHGDKRSSIGYCLGHSGLAVAMTSLTTAAGLLSFSTSEVAPIADLGWFAASGVMISLLYTLILLPSLIAILPLKQKQDDSTQNRTLFMDNLLCKISTIATTHSKKIVNIAAVLFIISFIGVMQINFKHDPLRWLPESWDSRQATELIDVKMRGTGIIEVVVDTGKVNGLYEPKFMNTLDELHNQIDELTHRDIFVGKTVSVVDILKESNRALHENKDEYYQVPQDKALIAQELFLFENSGSDDLEDFVDSQFSMARFTIKTPWVDAATNAEMIQRIETEFKGAFGASASMYSTGMASLFSRTMDAAIEGTKQSYTIAAFVICLMMIVLMGNVKLGLISMIPNLLPIFISMGMMGYFGLPLDMFTMLIGSISIGLVVDDTIHFMHNFRRYHLNCGDVNQAVRETLHSTGRAIVVTTIVLCLGFFIFMAASMENLFRFGLITGITIFLALLGDLFLAPALMKLLYDRNGSSNQKTTA